MPIAFSANEPFFEAVPVFEFDEARPENHASSIGEMPNGDMLVTWFGGSREGMPDVALWVSRRPKGLKTWSKPERLVDNEGLAEGNSVLFTDSKGKVWLFYVVKYGEERHDWGKCHIFIETSDDSGYTWSEPNQITSEFGWIIRNNVTELPDGKLLLPVYRDAEPFLSGVWISGDGFRTRDEYTVPITKPLNIQPAVVVLGSGRMALFARHVPEGGKIWMSTSDDWGKTWEKPKKMKFNNPSSGINAILLKSGAIVLAFNDSPLSRTPLNVALSEDGGESWKHKKTLESSYEEFSYPYMIQDSDGIIHITYTSNNRNFIKHAEFNEAWLKTE
ncbi:MAG: sialidase family protein [bacterium]